MTFLPIAFLTVLLQTITAIFTWLCTVEGQESTKAARADQAKFLTWAGMVWTQFKSWILEQKFTLNSHPPSSSPTPPPPS